MAEDVKFEASIGYTERLCLLKLAETGVDCYLLYVSLLDFKRDIRASAYAQHL